MVGYDSVVRASRRAGLNAEPTPSVALGSYEDTPLEMAGAYTVFANRGVYVKPYLISSIRAQNGSEIYSYQPETRAALDPRVAYLMVNMLEEVVRDRKSTRLNSSHITISYAVFCLKKKSK